MKRTDTNGEHEMLLRQGREYVESTLELCRLGHCVPGLGNSIAATYDTLKTARDIARAVFGLAWETHVFSVYDRLVQEQRHQQRVEKDEASR